MSRRQDPQPGRTGFARLRAPLSVALLASATLPAALFIADPIARDQGVFAYIAWRWLQGDVPYLLAGVEHKGPLVFAAYATAFRFFGIMIASARGLAWASLVVSTFLLAAIARRVLPREQGAGLLTGVTYALVIGLSGLSAWWSGAQTEAFMEPCLLGALCLALREPGSRITLLAGALIGVAALGKPTALLWLAPLLAAGPQRRWRQLVLLAAGAALPVAVTLAYFGVHGALGALVENVLLVNLEYGRQGLSQLLRTGGLFVRGQLGITPWPLLVPIAFGFWRLRQPGDGRAGRVVLAWLAAAYLALILQGRMFIYHFTPVVAPLALLATAGTWNGWRLTGGRVSVKAASDRPADFWRRLAGLLVVGFLALGLGRLGWGDLKLRLDRRAGRVSEAALFRRLSPPGAGNDVDPAETYRAGGWAAAHIPPDQTLLVWGFEPAVNFLSRRVAPTRYIYDYFLTSPAIPARRQERYWELFRQDLSRHPADWIAVVHNDSNPVEALDSAAQLDREPEMRDLLAQRYEPVERVGDFAFYRRRTGVPGPP